MTETIPGKAVDGALRVARLPADTLLKVAPESRVTTSVGLAVDRADAAVRDVAGSMLRDPALREDAGRRRAAAEERGRAVNLRDKAETRVETASERAEQMRREAEERRRQADEEAKRKQAKAKKEREQKKAQAAKSAERRKQAAQAKANKKEEAASKRGKVDKLSQLEKKSDALEVKEAAVQAADEARRLSDAAAKTKAKRKANSGSSRS